MKSAALTVCVGALLGAPFLSMPAGGQSIANVQQEVRQRIGHDVEWRKDAVTDRAVSNAVESLLRRKLSADAAVEIALLNNRDLQATLDQIGIAQADLLEAGLLKNPVFEASPRFPDRPPSGADVELSVADDFLDLIMLPLRRKVAAQELARTELQVGDEILKLAADTEAAYYAVQAAEQLQAEILQVEETGSAALQLATRQHDAGNTSDLDFANQQADASQIKLDELAVAMEIDSGREKLNRLMGIAGGSDTGWTLSPELPPLPESEPSQERLERVALAQRLDLAATKAQLASVVQALGITKTYRYVGTVDIGFDTESQTDHQRITGPTLRLELPLFNQGQGRIARLKAQLHQLENTIEAEAANIRSETREAAERVQSERKLVIYYRDQLCPQRKRILDLTSSQYNSMLKGGYDLLAAKQGELAADRGYIEATRDYWASRADLERAIGGTQSHPSPIAERKHP